MLRCTLMTKISETLCLLNSLSLSLSLARVLRCANRYCDVWIHAHMRGPCRATESTWPKGETIEVVIENRQPLVLAELWHVPPPLSPQNVHNTAEIKSHMHPEFKSYVSTSPQMLREGVTLTHSCFLFKRYRLRTRRLWPTKHTEGFCDFPRGMFRSMLLILF